jgi:hypothetical protein
LQDLWELYLRETGELPEENYSEKTVVVDEGRLKKLLNTIYS